MKRRFLVIHLTIVTIIALVVPAMASVNGYIAANGAAVSAAIAGNNANQGCLVITLTDNSGLHELTVQSPGNTTTVRDIETDLGIYTVSVVILGNRVINAAITGFTPPGFPGELPAAIVSAKITGNNANQGNLEITVTDASGSGELTIQRPGNNTATIGCIETDLGTYTVSITILGNRVTSATITNFLPVPEPRIITDTSNAISINVDALAHLGVGVRFDAKRSDTFASSQILQQISLWGSGLSTLSVEELSAALSAVSPDSEVFIGTGNVTAFPTRALFTNPDVQLVRSGTNVHGATSVNYTIANPTTSSAVYVFVVPPGHTFASLLANPLQSGTVMFYIEHDLAEDILRIDNEALAAIGIEASIVAKPAAFFSQQILRAIHLTGDDGILDLTVGQLISALQPISPYSQIFIGSGNVSVTPGRAILADDAPVAHGTNSHGAARVNYTIANPTTSNAVYVFVVPPGHTFASSLANPVQSGTVMFVVTGTLPIPMPLANLAAIGDLRGEWVDLYSTPGTYDPNLDAVLLNDGTHDAVLVFNMFDFDWIEIVNRPLPSLIESPSTFNNRAYVRVTDMNDFARGTFIIQNVSGANYLFIWQDIDILPPPRLISGDLIAIQTPGAGVRRAVIGGEVFNRGATILASAINTDPFIGAYPTGVYRIETDNEGRISDFWSDYKAVDEGYTIMRTARDTLRLGINAVHYGYRQTRSEYTYGDETLFFNLSAWTVVTRADFEAEFPLNQRRIGFQYWAADENDDGVLEALYYMASTTVTATNLPLLERFTAVVPVGATYSVVNADGTPNHDSGLKYTYFRPEGASEMNLRPLVVWLPGSGAGWNVWQNLILTAEIMNWTDPVMQSQFTAGFGDAGGAYILVPSMNVHPVQGMEYRWDSADGTIRHTPQLRALLETAVTGFIAAHNIDPDRIYIGGHSVGGGMVMYMIEDAPYLFAAAIPVSPTPRSLYYGYLPGNNSSDLGIADKINVSGLPVWLFMGQGDTVASQADSMPFAVRLIDGDVAAPATIGTRVTLFTSDDFTGAWSAHGSPASAVLSNLANVTISEAFFSDSGTAAVVVGGNTVTSAGETIIESQTLIEWLMMQ